MSLSEEQLAAQYAPLVRRLALQLAARLPASVELDDLMQAGMMGLLDAMRRYERMAQAQFETYAITRIRGAMLDELRGQDWLPRSVRSKAREIEAATGRLAQRLGRPPTEAEIACEMKLGLAEYRRMLEEGCGVQVIHYEDLAAWRNDAVAPEPVCAGEPSQAADPLQALVSSRLRQALIEAIKALPEREGLLLSLHFEHELNQKEISAVLGVTEGRVSQMRSQAVARIRAHLARADWHPEPAELAWLALM